MNCPTCGAEAAPRDAICLECGAHLLRLPAPVAAETTPAPEAAPASPVALVPVPVPAAVAPGPRLPRRGDDDDKIRCLGCGHWNAAESTTCRVCGARKRGVV
ncbi:MAG: hypothetical protein EXR72_06470 [Myxococcales bacterium]|nr:hypothetical protein [Myxococcales bacterium]